MAHYTSDKRIETVCFTGHRHIRYMDAVLLPIKLKKILTELIEQGATHFRAGGAMGFDTVAALCVLELKEKYPHIQLDLVLPCKDQTNNWDKHHITVYNYILSSASSVEYVSERFNNWCMMERNRRLVAGSDLCIAYLVKSTGGTAYTFGYALSKGLETINICD